MLTAKGIGGGGSAKVTNGILQEMYAAEGEIPANTFVEVRESVVPSDDAEKIVVLSEERISNSDNQKIQYSEVYSDLLFYVHATSDAANNVVQLLIEVSKLEHDRFMNKQTLALNLQSNWSGWSNYKYFNCVQLSDDKIMILFLYATSDNSTKPSIKYLTLNVSEDGQASVHKELQSLSVNIFNSMGYYDSATQFKVKRVDASTLCAFFSKQTTTVITSGSKYKHDSSLYALKLAVDDSYNLTLQGNALQFATNSLTVTDTSTTTPIELIGTIDMYNNKLIFTYALKKVSAAYYFKLGIIDVEAWTYALGASDDFKEAFMYNGEFYIIDNQLIIFSRPKQERLDAYIFSIYQNPNGSLTLTKVNSQYNLQINNSSIYMVSSPVLYLGNNRFIVDCAVMAPSGGKKYSYVSEFLFNGQTLNTNTEYFKMSDVGGATAPGWFLTRSGLVVTTYWYDSNSPLAYYRIIWTFGALAMFAYTPNRNKISGLTKTKCTETQKGQVWLLNTQEGEE